MKSYGSVYWGYSNKSELNDSSSNDEEDMAPSKRRITESDIPIAGISPPVRI